MISAKELRDKRVTSRIAGCLISERAGISRARLSEIELGRITPAVEEVARIERVLKELVEARTKVVGFAKQCGWPISAI